MGLLMELLQAAQNISVRSSKALGGAHANQGHANVKRLGALRRCIREDSRPGASSAKRCSLTSGIHRQIPRGIQ